MAKICFVNAYETSYLGTRILASHMLAHNHSAHNILLNGGLYIYIDEPVDKHEGYQSYISGKLMVNKATKYKVTEEELTHLKRVLQAENPDVIGFSARSTNNWLIPLLVPVFKAACPDALLVAGGYGPTLEPELYLKGGFDCVIRADGEDALLEVMDLVEEGKENSNGFDRLKATAINNSVWMVDGSVKYNPLSPQEKDISKYDAPLHGDRYFSYINEGILKRHYDPESHSKLYHTYIGRGCIGHCTYCSGGQWSSIYKESGAKYFKRRNRDIPELIEELKKLPESTSEIFFVDEFFALSKPKTLELCALLKKYVNKPFYCHINYDYMLENKNLFYALVDAGLTSTGVGFQTGSEEFAREHYHRNLRNSHLIEFAKLCFDTNVYAGIHLIGGNCYEDEATFKQTAELLRRLPFSLEYPDLLPIQNIRLRPHPQSPITYLKPKVVSDPMPAKEWLYRGAMWNMARILSEDEWEELYQRQDFKDDPMALNSLYLDTLLDQQRSHFRALIPTLEHKRVVYYGIGNLYENNKEFFKQLKPEAMICDSPYPLPAELDGVPCYEADDFLFNTKGEDIHFITFINPVPVPRIKLNFRNSIPNEKITSVTAYL